MLESIAVVVFLFCFFIEEEEKEEDRKDFEGTFFYRGVECYVKKSAREGEREREKKR